MKPITRTGDGASVYFEYDKRRELVRITVDRMPVEDASPAQCAAVRELAIQEWTTHVTNQLGERQPTALLADPTIWQFWTTAKRERIVLEELNLIERAVAW
jgi:hypothetical protein